MSYEASKAMSRRGKEFGKYFKGSGIDVGCGPDCVIAWKKKFPIRHVRAWDLADGDGQYLAPEGTRAAGGCQLPFVGNISADRRYIQRARTLYNSLIG
jgi:hypothetical protein